MDLAALILSGIALLFANYALIRVIAMEKSTHQVQIVGKDFFQSDFQPTPEDAFKQQKEEIQEEFKNDYPEFYEDEEWNRQMSEQRNKNIYM